MDFDTFWFSYPQDLSHKKKGAKPPAKRAWEKHSEEEQKRIHANMLALIKYDRHCLQLGEKADRWPHVSTFLNQGYYDREIESVSEKIVEKAKCKCGQPRTHGIHCLKCYWEHDSENRENLKRHAREKGYLKRKDESKEAYYERLRKARKGFKMDFTV